MTLTATDGAGQPLDADGLQTENPNRISTWTRRRPDPTNLDPEDVFIEDIAHALARQCRYNGHVEGFLSVARHCVWVADRLDALDQSVEIQLSGLLHDAAEAYLGDMVRPLKKSSGMTEFRRVDALADEAICKRFMLPYPIPEVVMEADAYVLLEVELKKPDGARYTYYGNHVDDEFDFSARYAELTAALMFP